MDKKTTSLVREVMERGEKMAPVRSLKLKVKFDKKSDAKKEYSEKKEELAKKKK